MESYNHFMIFTKSLPFTRDEVQKLSEQFASYIKTVIDVEKKICSAGCDRHFEAEKILINQGSNQENVWGGGIDIETKVIDCNSFINIRPHQQNASNEILSESIRIEYERLTRYFFGVLYE